MDKDEILKKAQAEGKDERELQVKDKSMMWAYIGMVLAAGVFSFIRSQQGLPIMDLGATVTASLFAGMTYRFIKTKDKQYAIIGLVALIMSIMGTVRFFMEY